MFIFSTGLFFVAVEGQKDEEKRVTAALLTSRDKTKKYNDSNQELLQTVLV